MIHLNTLEWAPLRLRNHGNVAAGKNVNCCEISFSVQLRGSSSVYCGACPSDYCKAKLVCRIRESSDMTRFLDTRKWIKIGQCEENTLHAGLCSFSVSPIARNFNLQNRFAITSRGRNKVSPLQVFVAGDAPLFILEFKFAHLERCYCSSRRLSLWQGLRPCQWRSNLVGARLRRLALPRPTTNHKSTHRAPPRSAATRWRQLAERAQTNRR